ncbi:GAF domain-containing sensor histidine kinase [Bradyrhizobium sp. SZCCHNR2028]|uniref:GAF domain-containing sensor histidine kinase n=1 Tax=Bradyrhizobium sp. SZCCHNR2028 TaxID=3057382 RepID=UPI0028EC69F0|nr:GAF domain-containing sensor histidine kinase [Bradyrhizobium sp. SZCCHNR2028]
MTTNPNPDVDAVQQLDAVPKILDSVSRITGMGFVAVARVTSDRWVCCAVRDDINFGLKEGGELRVKTTICSEVRERGEAVVIGDVETDRMFRDHPTPKLYGFRSYISAPITLSDGTIWGTLCAIDPAPRELDRPEIVSTFQLFGELIAAQLELHQRFALSQASLGLSEKSRFSTEQRLKITEADLLDERRTAELREQFIGVLGHDLRNPLASIDAGMRVLLRNQDSARAPEIISMIQKSVMRMAGLVDNIMDFARGRLGGGLTIKPDARQPLAPVIEQVVSEIRLAWPDHEIETHIDIAEPVKCDRSKIGQLFSNLLGNAISYGDKDKPIQVSATTSEGCFVLDVTNHGPPISDKAMQNLFKPYMRGERPSQHGLGLGLYIASEIARAHDGTLQATSTEDRTTFEFKMPLQA